MPPIAPIAAPVLPTNSPAGAPTVKQPTVQQPIDAQHILGLWQVARPQPIDAQRILELWQAARPQQDQA